MEHSVSELYKNIPVQFNSNSNLVSEIQNQFRFNLF